MKPADRVKAIVSEFSSDYLIVMGVGSEAVAIMSDPAYAKDALKLLPAAVEEAEEDARLIEAERVREVEQERTTKEPEENN